MAKNSYTRIASVAKACEIIAIVAEAKEPITGNDVAIRAQLPAGTVMCQLMTLEDAGLVEQVGDGWRMGLKMAVYWARIRSTKEAERDRLNKDLEIIGGAQ